MAHITLLAYPNCSISSISSPIDAFGIANMWHLSRAADRTACEPIFTWDIVTTDGASVEGFGRIPIQPHCAINDVTKTDFILIPGFLPPMDFIGNVPEVLSGWLRHWHSCGALIGTVCTGTFLLAETGLLNGKKATTNWAYANYFQRLYPDVRLEPERILTVDGGIVCTGATTAFLDLCLYLIEKYGSSDLAACCSKLLLLDPNRRSQSPYCILEFQKDHVDDKILKAQMQMEKNIAGNFSLNAMAKDLALSPRHFTRRFKNAAGVSPQTYLQRLRVEEAKRKLEMSLKSFDEITWHVGYENSNTFRRLFKRVTGLSPREYRNRFNRTPKNS